MHAPGLLSVEGWAHAWLAQELLQSAPSRRGEYDGFLANDFSARAAFCRNYGLVWSVISGASWYPQEMRVAEVKRVRIMDRVGLLAGLVVFVVGLLLWFAVGKPAQFYTTNGLFHGKVTIFIVAYALGIAGPILYWGKFLKAHAGSEELHPTAKWLKRLQGVQLLLLLLLPFLPA